MPVLTALAPFAASALVLASAPALGQSRPADAGQLIERLDRDRNGGLSREEIPVRMQRLRDNFERIDFDADGRITADELETLARARARRAAPAGSKPARAAGGPPATSAVAVATGAAAIDRRMNQAISGQELPGAVVLFVYDGEVVFERAYGWADIETGRPQRLDDLFNLGSTSKPLAMSAVMRLAASGKLQLDQTIDAWYPDYGTLRLADGTPVERTPTVREMMTHTSGTFANNCGRRIDLRLLYMFGRTLAESADAIARQPLVAKPGESFCYCGPSMQVLARIVERIAGDDFDRVAARTIFEPLGMDDTFYRTDENLSDRITVIYQKTASGLVRSEQTRNPQGDPFILAPGGMFSTAHDLARFVQMHLDGGKLDDRQILPTELVREMRRNQIGGKPVDLDQSAALGKIESYGLGWLLDEVEAGGQARLFLHGGAFGTYIWGDAKTRLGAVLLTQIPLPDATPVWNDVLAIARATWPGAEQHAGAGAGEWQPEVVLLGEAGRHYLDPETGLFSSADGLDTQMDSAALPLLESFNGPEFGDLLVLALIDDQAVGIWRDTGGAFWERIATLTPPPESNYTVFGSPEPLVANDKSYVSLVLKNDTALGFTDGEVWVLGIDPDPALRFARRVDDGASPVKRSDPESLTGANEVFIYYNAVGANGINEIHRARTGLATTAPDGVASELIDPVLTDPAIRPLTELPDAENRNLNHFVARNEVRSNGWLSIELSGSGGLPHDNQQVLLHAASLGLHAIGLAYPNWPGVTELTFESGDLDAPAQVRIERLYGIDASPLVDIDRPNSVVNRLVRLLEYLDGVYPDQDWRRFLRGEAGAREPDWTRILVGGHSQGAGHVAYLAGDVELAGGILFGGPGDFVQGLGPANWLLRPLAIPAERLFGFVHAFDPLYGAFQISQGILGLDAFGPIQDIDDLEVNAMTSHQYSSDLTKTCVSLATFSLSLGVRGKASVRSL